MPAIRVRSSQTVEKDMFQHQDGIASFLPGGCILINGLVSSLAARFAYL